MRPRYSLAAAAISLAAIGPAYDAGAAWLILPLSLASSLFAAFGFGRALAMMDERPAAGAAR